MPRAEVPVGFVNPQIDADLSTMRSLLKVVRTSAYHRLWLGASTLTDYWQELSFLAGSGITAPVGTGVNLTSLRHPADAASAAAAAARLSGQPVIAGFGPGAAMSQQALRGEVYRRPLTAMREYLTIARATLDGTLHDHRGAYFSSASGVEREPSRDVQLGAGVLRERMAELAGELADVAITWLAPPEYIRDVIIPALQRGADRVGRRRPRVAAMLGCALDRPTRNGDEMALATCGVHATLPHYTDMLATAGVKLSSGAAANARTLRESEVFVFGEGARVAARIEQFAAVGCDEVFLHLGGVYHHEGMRGFAQDLLQIQQYLI